MVNLHESLYSFPTAFASSYAVIALAEIGDKSQLVCMVLAARYRAWPVLLGVLLAFMLLNVIAVIAGTAVAHWLPDLLLTMIVATLFLGFGIYALRYSVEDDDEMPQTKVGHGVLISAFWLILIAEFGDKTQLAVAAMGSTANPYGVWLGATLALLTTSALAVWVGRTLMQKISMRRVHQFSGGVFILFGLVALTQGFI